MSTMSTSERKCLVNGVFIYNEDAYIHASRDRDLEFKYPLHVAIAGASLKCMTRLLNDGADVSSLDVNGSNIVHTVIIACSHRRDDEAAFILILRHILDHLTKIQLVTMTTHSNKDGYRPLELAARIGVYGIFRELLQYPGILVEAILDAGVNTYALFNLTQYENFSDRKRYLRSPLRMLVYMREDGLQSFKHYHISLIPIIQKWFRYKLRRTLPFLFGWFTIRIAFLTLLSLIDPSALLVLGVCIPYNNNTTQFENPHKVEILCAVNNHTQAEIQQTIQIAYVSSYWAVIIFCIDCIELIACFCDKERRIAYRGLYNPSSPFVAYTLFYRCCQFLLLSLCVVSVPLAKSIDLVEAIKLLYMLKACYLPLIIMAVLYMVEMAPVFGLFAITLQKMITSMLTFVVFLMLVKIAFARFFALVAKHYGFTSVAKSIYLLFMLETGSLSFGTEPETVIMVVHTVYYFISGILLLNYLIAVMSSLATNTEEDRDTTQLLRRLDMIYTVEERYTQWVWKAVNYFRGIRSLRIDAKIA